MERERLLKLLEKIESGAATTEELAEYNRFYGRFQTDERWNSLEMGEKKETGEKIYTNISTAIEKPVKKRRFSLFFKYAAAAAIIVVVLVGLYKLNHIQSVKTSAPESVHVQDRAPGGDKATLTLANGTEISLSDAANGDLIKRSGLSITKAADGQLIYKVLGRPANATTVTELNTIATPNGGQYNIVLSDGSKVWLNAASSLKFPSEFKGAERNVELNGEAYFEISKKKSMPFNVLANGTKVTVLGTHFNIMAYADGGNVKTTLLEGAVKLSHKAATALLRPGQQGVTTATGSFNVSNADIESVMAWKNGYFMFNDADLPEVMRQLSRWYDVDVVFENRTREYEFVGEISRKYSLQKVLKILELSGVHFKLTGRTLTVK